MGWWNRKTPKQKDELIDQIVIATVSGVLAGIILKMFGF